MRPRFSLIVIVWVSLAFAVTAGAQPAVRNILVVKSFDRDPFDAYVDRYRAELAARSPEPINVFEVSLQPSPFARVQDEQPMVDFLLAAVSGRKLDLVVSVGGPAANFSREYRPQLFPETPLLQTAVDARASQGGMFGANETSTLAAMDFAVVIENFLALRPDTNHIAVVIGSSQHEEFWRAELLREFERFSGRLSFEWWNSLSLEEMLQRAAVLPAGSALLFSEFAVDGHGVLQSAERAAIRLHEVSSVPMLGVYDIQIGRGIVGGPLMSIANLVSASTDVSLRILGGESPAAIRTPPQPMGPTIYDWRELRRWGIPESRLPAGSVVRFREFSLWEQYRFYIAGAIAIVVVQTGLIAGLITARIRRRRTEAELRQASDRNRDLAGRLINAQEQERARIARDLHDDVSQQLAGLSIMMSGLRQKIGKPDPAGSIDDSLRSIQDQTTTLARSVRDLSHELHPDVLKHAGLVVTLQRHCAQIAKHYPVVVTFNADDNLGPLTKEAALCLFRVAQEALTNAVRHSKAKTITVNLEAMPGHVELIVQDDGVGFSTTMEAGRGLGLRSIDERVRLVGGHVTVTSKPGAGTTLRVLVPQDTI